MRAPDRNETEDFHRDGYVLVRGALSADELAAAEDAGATFTPTRQEFGSAEQYAAARTLGIFHRPFPFGIPALDRLVVDESLVDWCSTQIGDADLALGDAMVWRKYAGFSDFDQSLHQDYPNNDLAFPRRDGGFLQITFILYLTEVTPAHGPTHALAHPAVPLGLPHFLPDRHAAADAYAKEVPVLAEPGDLLVYETSTYHRGSAMADATAERLTVHFQYAAAAHRWLGKVSYGVLGATPEMRLFLSAATPRQRTLLGFPPVDSPYWTRETLDAVQRRYPEMDLAPYRVAARQLQ